MENKFRELIKTMKSYNDAIALMAWDLRTGAPRRGVSSRAEVISMLSTEVFRMSTSSQMEECLNFLEKDENYNKLDDIMKVSVADCKKEFNRSKKIPEKEFTEYVMLVAESETIWEEAKSENDFSKFAPYLEKIVDYNKRFIGYWGYEGNKYNTLLDYYEPGMTVEKLDRIFNNLRENIVPLVLKIAKSDVKADLRFLDRVFDKEGQKKFSNIILDKMGFDFKSGRLDESEHPFTIGITPGDVRITTHYYPNDFRSAVFSAVHEGGHALYEQNIDEKLNNTLLCTGTSMGIHESQSRFWENMIGRSSKFWNCFFDDLKSIFKDELSDYTYDDIYKAVNSVQPSFIRVEADELTYNLHIMIRYEIEKALINDEIKVADLPRIWNEKMEEYLGIVPPNDTQGVLQDVHWAGGMIGYFPSYSLGNIYSAQIYNKIRSEMPDFDMIVSNGDLTKIKEWLSDKIHKYGKLKTPSEILFEVTGEELDAKYLIDYLKEKYSEIYNLED